MDPSGIPTEIFDGHPVNPQPDHPSRGGTGFKTSGQGLGHILVHAPDIDASVRFYRDLLGFRVTDFTTIATPRGPLRLAFLHCKRASPFDCFHRRSWSEAAQSHHVREATTL